MRMGTVFSFGKGALPVFNLSSPDYTVSLSLNRC